MLEASHTNSPNTSMQPMVSPAAAASHSTSMISDGSSRESKRAKTRTEFYAVAKKVIDEMNHEDIPPEIEDDSKAGYFSPDPDPEAVEEEDEATIIRKSRDRIASSAYEIYFKPGVFVKFFLMHILFFFIFGPFIFLLAPIFGKYVLINQGFMGISNNFFIQSIQYAALISFLVSYYLAPIKGLQAMEVYMICIAVLVRLITISSKYAYQSESFLKLLHTTKLTKQDSQGDLILFGWRLQHDVVIEEELQAAILRLEIDSSLFFFNFLGKASLKLKESLSKHKMIGRLTANEVKTLADEKSGVVGSGNLVTFSNRDHHTIALESRSGETVRHRIQTTARDILASERRPLSKSEEVRKRFKKAKEKIEEGKKKEKNTKTAQEIFKSFSHFLGTKKLEKSHLYGYNLAFDLLKYVRDLRYRYLGTSLMMISIVRSMIPTFYRMYLVYQKKEDIPIFTAKPFVVVILIISNSLFFWFNIFILSVPILDTYSKTVVFKQIGYLISPRKIAEFRDRKLYPTLNIFDPVTLKTWSNFRRLMNSYGRKYTLRSNFNVTITMVVYSIVLGILILQATGLVNTYSNPLLLVILSYETVVFFTIFILIMLGGAFVNNQYKVHKNLLKKNKTIISDFQQLSYLYVGKEAIEPDNYIYKEGLKLLRAELGTGDNEEEDFEEKLIARSEKLSTMIDDIIEELDFEEENEPFTVLGVPITYGILKSLAAGVASLGFALSQMVMS